MAKDDRDILELLKDELDFIEKEDTGDQFALLEAETRFPGLADMHQLC